MKCFLVLITGLLLTTGAIAQCSYSGNPVRQNINISPKILSDDSTPVGTILYSQTVGASNFKTFSCQKSMNDQYMVNMGADAVPGVKGIQGKPVYETGIDGLGFQVSDIFYSKNGSLVAAETHNEVVPYEKGTVNHRLITTWLIKTKPVIDTSTTSLNPVFTFSVGNPTTNPTVNEKLIYQGTLKLTNVKYRATTCDISIQGTKVITLNRIEKSTLMSNAKGDTSNKKDIVFNLNCPESSVGNSITYWFNPLGSTNTTGVIDNMITGVTAAKNVGVIFKANNKSIVFYDLDEYGFKKVKKSETFSITADYYRQSDKSEDIGSGAVKAMLEVVLQEN